ncbi:telomere repeats-binding bouquet formation protein 2-like isoform X2 [Gigantopelta aegis]|uniref:telomere repeats-binding bouquet formation protein 2-like isoform X2 n=1 Tax=Gigantopelta aegis TaxID=1735272 RepID=UPI001B888E41|nr:telomere repeats-binding bouquet formation protein 2-like isoform X2 [Gigantopelta aegis]
MGPETELAKHIKMFHGLSAWFSQSVAAKRKRLWKQHGGEEVDFDDAKFIFSEDSECDDTKRLYQSDEYLNECLAIFHASYINQCVKEEDVGKVVLGKYFLPPTDIQKLTKMNWDWAKIPDGESTNSEDESEEESTSQNKTNTTRKKPSAHPETVVTGSKDDKTRKKPASQVTMVTDNTTRKRPFSRTDNVATQSRDDTTRKKPATQVTTATGGKEKVSTGPSNKVMEKTQKLTITDAVHIDTLPRITGLIEDLVPGQHNFQVYLKTPCPQS